MESNAKVGGKSSRTTFEGLGSCCRLSDVDPAAATSEEGEMVTSLVLCRPQTGRTHQIRQHLQSLGYPIANDPMYGGLATMPDPYVRDGSVGDQRALVEMIRHGVAEAPEGVQLGPVVEHLLAAEGKEGTSPWTNKLVWTRGIWLHAWQYDLEFEQGERLVFEAKPPPWARFSFTTN